MAPKVDIWMPVYVGDYLADTMHLTTEQHGAYFLLMLAYWKNKGPLPESRIKSICRYQGDASSNAYAELKHVLKEFFNTECKPGYWIHKRIDKELAKAKEEKQKRIDRAKKGAAKRWGSNA